MKQGLQIAYIPLHTHGDINHPDVEFGFTMYEQGDCHACRYWRRGEPGVLRTTANSEMTPTMFLVHTASVKQAVVNAAIKKILEEECDDQP